MLRLIGALVLVGHFNVEDDKELCPVFKVNIDTMFPYPFVNNVTDLRPGLDGAAASVEETGRVGSSLLLNHDRLYCVGGTNGIQCPDVVN